MNRPPYGDMFRRSSQFYKMFEVIPQVLPNKTVKVNPGSYTKNGNEVVEYIGGNTIEINPPATGAKWVLITLSQNNTLTVLNGESSLNSPPVPVITETSLPLALIYYKSNDTVITMDMIYDVRPFFGIYFETVEKLTVENFNTTLTTTVDALNNVIINKADMDGTNSSEFVLNREESGALSTDALITINRGSATNVSIKWNEETDHWQYTNDGITFVDFGNSWDTALASTTNIGNTKLSLEPLDLASPVAVGNNDTRLFTDEAEKVTVLNHLANTSDPHGTLNLLTNNYTQEFHISSTGDDTIGDGSEIKPFKTIAKAISLNVNSNSTAIYLHKAAAENLVLNNVENICFVGVSAPNDSQVTTLYGNHVISGTSTRMKFVNISMVGTVNTSPVLDIQGTAGRHYFQNVTFGFSTSSTNALVKFSGTNQRWNEFNSCFIDGKLSLEGTPNAGTVVRIIGMQSWGTLIDINNANYNLICYDLARLGNINHVAGNVILRNIHDFKGNTLSEAITSTSNTGYIYVDSCNFKYTQDLSYKKINKTGTCDFALINSNHDHTIDTLTGNVMYGRIDADIQNTSTVTGLNIKDAFDSVKAILDTTVLTTDTRLFADEVTKLNVLSHLTNTADPHGTLALLNATNLPAHTHVATDLDAVTQGLINNSVQNTDLRLFTDEAEKLSVLNAITATQTVEYSDLSPSLISKLAEVDANETIVGVFTFSPGIVHAPFYIGANAMDQLVPGLNADKLQGQTAANFISSSDASGQIFLTDQDVPSNKYRLEIKSGVLVITPVI
jgi:hypothetical protein